MKLPAEAIQEYKTLHQAEFGEVLSDEEAERYANRMFSLLHYIFTHNENERCEPT